MNERRPLDQTDETFAHGEFPNPTGAEDQAVLDEVTARLQAYADETLQDREPEEVTWVALKDPRYVVDGAEAAQTGEADDEDEDPRVAAYEAGEPVVVSDEEAAELLRNEIDRLERNADRLEQEVKMLEAEAERDYPLRIESLREINNFIAGFAALANADLGIGFNYVYADAFNEYQEQVRDRLLESLQNWLGFNIVDELDSSEHTCNAHDTEGNGEWMRPHLDNILVNAADVDLSETSATHRSKVFGLNNRHGLGIILNEFELADPNYKFHSTAPVIRLIGAKVVEIEVLETNGMAVEPVVTHAPAPAQTTTETPAAEVEDEAGQ